MSNISSFPFNDGRIEDIHIFIFNRQKKKISCFFSNGEPTIQLRLTAFTGPKTVTNLCHTSTLNLNGIRVTLKIEGETDRTPTG